MFKNFCNLTFLFETLLPYNCHNSIDGFDISEENVNTKSRMKTNQLVTQKSHDCLKLKVYQ